MNVICIVMAIVCIALLVFQIRNLIQVIKEYKRMKAWYSRGMCHHENYKATNRNLEEYILAVVFFTGIIIFFFIITLNIPK